MIPLDIPQATTLLGVLFTIAIGFLVFVLKTALARTKGAQTTKLLCKTLTPASLAQIALILSLIQGGVLVAT